MFVLVVSGLVATVGLLRLAQAFLVLPQRVWGVWLVGLNVGLAWLIFTAIDSLNLRANLASALISPIALSILNGWRFLYFH